MNMDVIEAPFNTLSSYQNIRGFPLIVIFEKTCTLKPFGVESGWKVQRPEVTGCNFTAPIATLGALRNPREVLLHPNCTQIRRFSVRVVELLY